MSKEKNFRHNIYLIGFMGVGKSAISKYLHSSYGMEIIEMDQVISDNEGMSISDIFKTHGEEYFRNAETKLLKDLQSKGNMVVSCGGGTAMRQFNVDIMKNNGKVVLLTARPETIYDRVKDSHDRPLLENNMTVEYIEELMSSRNESYKNAADIIIETDGKTKEEICRELIKRLQTN